MIDLKKYEFYFVTGSQDLYGAETLKKVDEHSKAMVESPRPEASLQAHLEELW
jgi:L-arabinose isomerase